MIFEIHVKIVMCEYCDLSLRLRLRYGSLVCLIYLLFRFEVNFQLFPAKEFHNQFNTNASIYFIFIIDNDLDELSSR